MKTNNTCPTQGNPRQTRMLVSTLSNPDPRYWISDFFSNLGLRIPIVSGIPDSKVHDSEFQKQKFPGYRIPQEKVPGFWNRDYLKWAAIKQINSKREVQHFLSTNCDRHFKIFSQYFMEKKTQ